MSKYQNHSQSTKMQVCILVFCADFDTYSYVQFLPTFVDNEFIIFPDLSNENNSKLYSNTPKKMKVSFPNEKFTRCFFLSLMSQ